MTTPNAGGGPFRPGPLTTSVIGSHARPGWLEVAVAAAARGELDLNRLARVELASRGLDRDGVWVGFERAREIHGFGR